MHEQNDPVSSENERKQLCAWYVEDLIVYKRVIVSTSVGNKNWEN